MQMRRGMRLQLIKVKEVSESAKSEIQVVLNANYT